MKRWMTMAAAGWLTTGMAMAAPFNAAEVPADACWFAHADLDIFKGTEVGKFVLAKVNAPDADRKLAVFATVFGFDPRRDISSLTAFGRSNRPEQGVILIRGRLDASRLTTLLQANDTFRAVTNGTRVVMNWIDEKKLKAGKKDRTFGCFHSSGVAVMGSSDDDVNGALDVLDSRKPSLAGSPLLASLGPAPATPVLAVVFDAAGKAPVGAKTEILKLARRAALSVGESAGLVRARLQLEAPDASTAAEMMKIADGMRSLMVLNKDKDPQAAQLAQGANVSASGLQVVVTLDYPAAELIKTAERKEAEATRRKAAE